MTEFNKKYAKGRVLFVVLLFYEVPIVLNYLSSAARLGGVGRPTGGTGRAGALTPPPKVPRAGGVRTLPLRRLLPSGPGGPP